MRCIIFSVTNGNPKSIEEHFNVWMENNPEFNIINIHITESYNENYVYTMTIFYKEGMRIKKIARLAHEINRAYCEAIGDFSQLKWEDAPDWQTQSAVDGVKFHLKNENVTPEQSHENWLKQKREEGWKYGKVKDADKKEHPCFVPYSELPQEQKVKDYLFKAVVTNVI